MDVLVIGAGFGGLGTALRLCELGARVQVIESLTYPGGCASTFRRNGVSFESGATLCAGLGPEELFTRWIDRYSLDVTTEEIDPVVELRYPGARLAVPSDRERFVESLLRAPSAPITQLSRFFEHQRRIADALWSFFRNGKLPPRSDTGHFIDHVRTAQAFVSSRAYPGRTLFDLLERYGLRDYEPLRIYLDALCQITVQCSASEAEALFALGAMDYYFRGVKHVRGGIGALAAGIVNAIRALGGAVRFATAASRIEPERGQWRVQTRRGDFVTPIVVANLLPQSLGALLGNHNDAQRLRRLSARVAKAWGAAMLYRVVRAPANASPSATHLALVQDPDADFVEGNHVFCSFGSSGDGSVPLGYRTLTVSTHVRPVPCDGEPESHRAGYVASTHNRMRETLAELAPEWEEHVLLEMTASPRTFERFTGRFRGLVGGVPRRAGLHNYTGLFDREVLAGVHLVGDSLFPGQSTLAAAIGGTRTAETIAA